MEQIFLDIFKRHLLKEEEILWFEKPNVKKLFSPKDIYSIFFGTVFIVTSSIWTIHGIMIMRGLKVVKNMRPDQGIIFILLGISITLLGIYQIIGKPLRRKHKKENTFYAITNKRLLILIAGTNEKVISKYISQINEVYVTTSNNGIGTIEFGENYPDGEFSDISNAENVYELVNDLRSKIN